MVSMFSDLEKTYKKKFIQLYEEFLENPKDESIKKRADGMGALSGPEFSKEISKAALGAYKIELGELSIDDAKKILKELKNNTTDSRLNEFNEEAKKKLIELYTEYIKDTSDDFIQNSAVDIGNEFGNATDAIFNETILEAINNVDSIAFGELSVEEAKEILKRLKELN